MEWTSRLKEAKFWLLGIAVAIAAIHLTLVDRIYKEDLFATSALFWIAAGTLLWEKRDDLKFQSNLPAMIAGVVLLGLVLLRSSALPTSNFFLCALPFIGLLGLALIASGLSGLRQYWRELAIFGFMAFYPLVERFLRGLPLPIITAKASNLMLWYSGTDTRREGVFLYLSGGRSVEVYEACSGVQSILQMLCVSVLFLFMFPLRPIQRVICVTVAVLIGFFVNAIRVCIMALLVNQKALFDFWHTGQGSLIFSVIAVAIFGAFCWFAFLRTSKQTPIKGA